MATKLSLIIVITILICSCSKNEFNNSYTLEESGDFSIALDSFTSYKNSCFQYAQTDSSNKESLTFLNRKNNSIYIYNYLTKKLKKTITYKKEGPHGVGSIKSYYLYNSDSIFLINSARKIMLNNEKGKLSYSISTLDMEKSTPNTPDIIHTSTLRPISKIGNNLYINGVFIGVKDINPIYKLDLNTSQLKTLFNYPKIDPYTNNKRLDIYFYLYCSTYNPDKQTICYSFPADDSITVTNHKNLYHRYKAASHNIDEINPYIDDSNIPDDKYEYLTAKKNMYHAIIYDKYNKMYYRIIKFGISDADYSSGDINRIKEKEFAIIILDSTFNKVGEVVMKRFEYDPSTFFVNEFGLHILNRRLCLENENKAFFTIFKPQKLAK